MNKSILSIFFFTGLALLCSCKKTSDTPNGSSSQPGGVTLSTKVVTIVCQEKATCGGNITSEGSSSVIARGVCWNTSPNPTIANSKTVDGSGSGDFSSAISGLTMNTTYYLRAYATNNTGTSYGAEVNFTTPGISFQGMGMTDNDGNVYTTVIIGCHEWMAENLRVTHYSNNEPITNPAAVPDWLAASTAETGGWCYYENNPGVNDTYGKLYNWYAGTDSRGIAPAGWRIPTEGDFSILSGYFGGDNLAGNSLKEGGNAHWNSPSASLNESGFTALPGGFRNGASGSNAGSSNLGKYCYLGTSGNAVRLDYNTKTIIINTSLVGKGTGVSIRLVKDL